MGLFYFFIVLFFVSHFPQNIAAHKASALETACQSASQKDACVAALSSDPNARSSDLKGLSLIALSLAASNASDVAELFKAQLNNDSSLDPAVQDGASECLEFYIDAAEQLEGSVAAVLADAHKDVKTWLEVAVTDANSCDAALGAYKKAVIGDKGEAFRRLCEYATVVHKLLAEHKEQN